MTRPVGRPSLEEVLDAFAVEAEPGRKTLERYLRAYPEYAAALVALSYELARPLIDDVAPPSPESVARFEALWAGHPAARPAAAPAAPGAPAVAGGGVPDPLAVLPVAEQRRVAEALRVPRQVLTALRERRVLVASIPAAFLARLAEAVPTPVEALLASLAQPAVAVSAGRRYKADGKPESVGQASFEQVLRESGVSDRDIVALLADHTDR